MDDLEVVKACASAMGYRPYERAGVIQECSSTGIYIHDASDRGYGEYDPARNDAQAMALVRKFGLRIEQLLCGNWIAAKDSSKWTAISAENADLNRAICLCVAQLAAPK